MGGLKKYLPITFITFLIGTLALVGTPFFSGFYSKEHIIEAAGEAGIWGSTYAYYATLIGVFVTSLYSFRLYFLVFHGKERFRDVKHDESHGHDDHHAHGGDPHESPWVVTLPLVLLAIPSIFAGIWFVDPLLFGGYFDGIVTVLPEHPAMATLAEHWTDWMAYAVHGFGTLPFWLVVAGAVVAGRSRGQPRGRSGLRRGLPAPRPATRRAGQDEAGGGRTGATRESEDEPRREQPEADAADAVRGARTAAQGSPGDRHRGRADHRRLGRGEMVPRLLLRSRPRAAKAPGGVAEALGTGGLRRRARERHRHHRRRHSQRQLGRPPHTGDDMSYPVKIERSVWVPMEDGTRVALTLYLPDAPGEGPFPAVLESLPYRKDDDCFDRDYKTYTYLAERGIAGVRIDIRGTGGSDGACAQYAQGVMFALAAPYIGYLLRSSATARLRRIRRVDRALATTGGGSSSTRKTRPLRGSSAMIQSAPFELIFRARLFRIAVTDTSSSWRNRVGLARLLCSWSRGLVTCGR